MGISVGVGVAVAVAVAVLVGVSVAVDASVAVLAGVGVASGAAGVQAPSITAHAISEKVFVNPVVCFSLVGFMFSS
jgi:hypothetical protein